MILLSHPTGNQNSRQAARALHEAGALFQFNSSVHFNAQCSLASLLPPRIRTELSRRDFSDDVPTSKLNAVSSSRELIRIIGGKLGWQSLIAHESGWASIDAVYHAVDRATARSLERHAAVDSVFAYEDGALETFRSAKARHCSRIYELPIGYWRAHRRICEDEARRKPAWAHTWNADKDSREKIERKDHELKLASRILVPSRFVADSLGEYPDQLAPISIVPYGCPTPISPTARRWASSSRLRILFVGGLSQRKGLSYLLDAMEPLGSAVELTIIGTGPGRELLGNRHRLLGSQTHAQVLEAMRTHDVFVLPSLFEGFGMVITEALAQGMPVIITNACGPADIITDEREGWIVPIRDSEAITQKLQQCIDTPGIIEKMGKEALKLAAQASWSQYRKQLRTAVLGSRESSAL